MSTFSCEWELWSTRASIVVTDVDALDAARTLAQELLDEVERASSRFRSDSELLNLGWDSPITVSPVLADLLGEALAAARLSDGAVDPTVGTAMVDLGYDRDLALVRMDGRPVRAVVRRVPGWRSLALEGRTFTRPRGVQLDLGATSKAVAADRLAARIAEELCTGALVSLGGDIATAGPSPEGGWQVAVQDVAADPAAHLSLSSGAAIATSSTVRRTWRRGEVELHHIVDPETSQPAARIWRSATVVAPTCVEANTLSTGALVKGTAAPAWLTRMGRPARLVSQDGRVVTLSGWPEERAA